jgi:hypothetical protein
MMERCTLKIFMLVVLLFISTNYSKAGGKIGINFIYMVPYGSAATNFSDPGAGVGLNLVLPIPPINRVCAIVIGAEIVNLKMQSMDVPDLISGDILTQQTTQNYSRYILGIQIGGYSRESLRPHGGLNLALVRYSIGTDLIYPDGDNETLSEEIKTIFGCDMTFGLDLNFNNNWNLDFGVRYVKSFGLVQQLGDGLVTIHPEYFQAYIGAGISFEYIFGSIYN